MVESRRPDEPELEPPLSRPEARVRAVLERCASVLSLFIALLLIAFVGVTLVGVVVVAWEPLVHGRDFMRSALDGMDAAFLAIILLELVHTTLARGPISSQLQEFLMIGITSAIRSGLEIAAGGRTRNPRDVAIDLAISALSALVLVAALWLLRQRLHVERSSPR